MALLLGGGRRRLLGALSSLLLRWQCSALALLVLLGRYARLATGRGSSGATNWPAFRRAAAVPGPLPLLPEAPFQAAPSCPGSLLRLSGGSRRPQVLKVLSGWQMLLVPCSGARELRGGAS